MEKSPSANHRLPTVTGYELLDELGRGTTGVVYKARQKALNRLVAVKMILAGNHTSAEQLVRFETEARAVAALKHPNIVQIYDLGESDGLPFLSLEFVDGACLLDEGSGDQVVTVSLGFVVGMLASAEIGRPEYPRATMVTNR